MVVFALFVLTATAATPYGAENTPLDRGYRAMYNLDFAAAHQYFATWEKANPGDPMGPISDAAAYLFSEFRRLHILESEFLTQDSSFADRQHDLRPDPAAKQAFDTALNRGKQIATGVLTRSRDDENALLASLLGAGLHADYLAFIEKRNFAALSEIKQSRSAAEHLLSLYPNCYDAYLAVGVENYTLSLKPAPLRWALRLAGAETDKQTGIERLRITAEKGHYLLPYARLLLAVAALRDHDTARARELLSWLSSEFPGNELYRQELRKLQCTTGSTGCS